MHLLNCFSVYKTTISYVHYQSFRGSRFYAFSSPRLQTNNWFVCTILSHGRKQRGSRQAASYSQISSRCLCVIGVAGVALLPPYARTLQPDLQKPYTIISPSSDTLPDKVEFRDLMAKQSEARAKPAITEKVGNRLRKVHSWWKSWSLCTGWRANKSKRLGPGLTSYTTIRSGCSWKPFKPPQSYICEVKSTKFTNKT